MHKTIKYNINDKIIQWNSETNNIDINGGMIIIESLEDLDLWLEALIDFKYEMKENEKR